MPMIATWKKKTLGTSTEIKPNRSAEPKHADGFTLLEVVIALAIMVLSFSSILAVEGGSINATARAKQMNIVAMLARNKMVETEFELQNKPLNEAKKEESGTFNTPYEDFRWKTTIKEIEFPALNLGSTTGSEAPNPSRSSSSSSGSSVGQLQTQMESTVTKMLTTYINKTIREVTVSIIWKKGNTDQTYSLATFWVDLNHEFNANEF